MFIRKTEKERTRPKAALAGLGAAALVISWGVGAGSAFGTPAHSATAHSATKANVAPKAHPAKKGPAALPVGATTGFPFGYTMDEGTKISLLPPNDADVNQARVKMAPRLGPWRINLAAGVKAWPNACKLTNIAQLHELFPAITGLQGKPVGAKGQILGSGANTPNNVQCTYHLKTTYQPAGYTTYSQVVVQLEEVDTNAPAVYQQDLAQQKASAKKFPAQYANYPQLEHGVKCFDDSNELQCLKDDVSFWISGPKVTGGSNYSADQAVWIDQIQIPLAEVIGSELSTTL